MPRPAAPLTPRWRVRRRSGAGWWMRKPWRVRYPSRPDERPLERPRTALVRPYLARVMAVSVVVMILSLMRLLELLVAPARTLRPLLSPAGSRWQPLAALVWE